MSQRLNINCILRIITVLILNGLIGTTLLAQNKQQVVVTISGISSEEQLTHFNKGEELREQMKFFEAIEEYKQVISPGELCGKESEAQYNIGLCYTWLGKMDEAEAVFKEMLKTYPDDVKAIAYAEFCLSWIDVQRGNFDTAIMRLEQSLAKQLYKGKEHCAATQLEIGRIYLYFLNDYDKAKQAFQKVLMNYPDTETAKNPLLSNF